MLVGFPSFSIFWSNLYRIQTTCCFRIRQKSPEKLPVWVKKKKKAKNKQSMFPFHPRGSTSLRGLWGGGEMNQHKYLKPLARGAKGTDNNSSQL